MKFKYMMVKLGCGDETTTEFINKEDWNKIIDSYKNDDEIFLQENTIFTNSNGITTIDQEEQIVMRIPNEHQHMRVNMDDVGLVTTTLITEDEWNDIEQEHKNYLARHGALFVTQDDGVSIIDNAEHIEIKLPSC